MGLKKFLSLSALLLFGNIFAQQASSDPSAIFGPTSPISSGTGRYIVKFSQTGSAKFRKRDGSPDTAGFFRTLEDSGKTATPALSFTSDIFHGASFDLSDGNSTAIAEIEALAEVEKVWSASLFSLPVIEEATVQSEFPAWTPHNDTGVTAAHALGYRGKDVIVAIVDTGIDYNHPALGGGFGPGFKVEAGYDLVGDDYVAGGPYLPDPDPMDCAGHGTHVAGIVGSINEAVPGVAPDARIRIYKVFGCDGSTYEDVIVAGFLQAYEEGADIISASLGSDRGFDDTPLALVATQIQALGVFVSIAAGNSGVNGPFYTSSGGNGQGSMAVGSAQSDNLPGFTVVAHSSSGESKEIIYLSDIITQWPLNGTYDAAWYPDSRNYDPCLLNSGNPSVPSSSVLVLPRGNCTWQFMDSSLYGKAEWVFYYNFEGSDWEIPDRVRYNMVSQPDGFSLIDYEAGDWLLSQHENNYTVTYEFVNDNKPAALEIVSLLGGRMNDFSSWGPTLDARMKPEISAPGSHIFSTWPLVKGTWATLSGTSMATPYLSGVAALFFGSRGGRAAIGEGAAQLAHERIVSSGKPILHFDGTDNLAAIAQQGAGLVDAYKVVEYVTSVSPGNINLNDTDHFQATHEIRVSNSGTETVTYQFYHETGVTIHTKNQGDAWVALNPPYSMEAGDVAEVELSDSSLTLGPGETGTLTVTFTEPSGIAANMLPVYGGSIQVIGSQGEALRVTYMGIKGSLYGSNVWEMERGVPLLLSGYGGVIEEGHNYTFEDGGDVPQPYFNMLWSTRELGIDFVDRDWNESDWVYPPVPGQAKIAGFLLTVPTGLDNSVASFPIYDYPRNSLGVYAEPSNKFADGRDIPAGEYKLLCRVLRTYGDPSNLEDWQYKVSPWFRITREKPPVTSEPPTSSTTTAIPTPTSFPEPCVTTATPVTLQAQIGNDEKLYNLYFYSDFLSIDLSGSQTLANFSLNSDGSVQNWHATTDYFFSVHTNNNSLIYDYPSSRITGAWSYLSCSNVDGFLQCQSNGKTALYVCDATSGILRHGVAPLDGCQSVRLAVASRVNPTCDEVTTTSVATTLATVVARAT